MPDQISVALFEHLMDLAALDLDPKEAEYLRRELNNQLTAISELEAIPLDSDTAVTSHGVPYTPRISSVAREDVWRPYANPDEILNQAPERYQRYIVVPDIPHTELE